MPEVRKAIVWEVPEGARSANLEVNERRYLIDLKQSGNDILEMIEYDAFERGKRAAIENVQSNFITFLQSFGGSPAVVHDSGLIEVNYG